VRGKKSKEDEMKVSPSYEKVIEPLSEIIKTIDP
jgi:hypothetical protein